MGVTGHMLRFELPQLKSETKLKTVTGVHEMVYVNGMFVEKYCKVKAYGVIERLKPEMGRDRS